MPTLNWIGKEAVVNHHQQVPFHLLRDMPELACGQPGNGNLIVQGDNLIALKALLPYYAGQVKCIYIDPPYNTGNEGWVYNDNVNSSIIREWLGKTVGKEGETLDRHDRWLCMMYPRLVLLKQFLREDGVILISIDDFEAHNLRSMMEELFGGQNFIAQLVWDKTRKNDAKLFSVGHEYLLVFANSLKKIKELKTVWREQKPGAKEVIAKWRELVVTHGKNYEKMQEELREWYKSLDKKHPAKKLRDCTKTKTLIFKKVFW
jgi:adenine-specific DNA-methyltransferase